MVRTVSDRVMAFVLSATTVARALVGMAVVRIGVGVGQLSLYLADYGDRRFLYGADGAFARSDISMAGGFNLYTVAGDSVAAFEVVYHLGALACLALALGLGGRLIVALTWVTSWSTWQANPMLIDGGDNLTMIVLPLLFFSQSMSRLSLRPRLGVLERLRWLERNWIGILLHNAAVVGVMGQICVVYFVSGIYKMQGQMWVDGTALYYIMRTPEFFHPTLSPLFFENDTLVVLGTYSAMVLLVAFPFMVLSRSVRRWAVAAMLGFHFSIALFMGLTSFALVMMACDCVFVSNEIERVRTRMKQRLRLRRSGATSATDPASAPAPRGGAVVARSSA